LHNPALAPLALALDELREDHYYSLYNLYGAVDLMDSAHLTEAFTRLAPGSLMDAHGLMAMQNAAFGNTLQDRLSLLSRSGGPPLGLTVMGAPEQVLAFGGDEGMGAASQLAFASMVTNTSQVSLPGGFSGFVAGGYGETDSATAAGRSSSSPDDGLRTWNIIGGIEHAFGDMTVGIAGGYSHGTAQQSATYALAENDVSQTALYGVYRFDHGVYISGLAGYGASRTSTERRFAAGGLDYQMAGDVGGDVFMASVEGGVNFEFANGLTLTPNVSLRQFSVRMDGFTESGGETALEISERRYGQLEGRVGARLSGDFAFDSGWSLAPSLDVSAVSLLEAEGDGVMARFAAASDVPFYLPGPARDSFWGEVAGGVSLVRGETSFSLRMDTSVGREEQHEDRYMARFAQRF
jgi:hypothetical protein